MEKRLCLQKRSDGDETECPGEAGLIVGEWTAGLAGGVLTAAGASYFLMYAFASSSDGEGDIGDLYLSLLFGSLIGLPIGTSTGVYLVGRTSDYYDVSYADALLGSGIGIVTSIASLLLFSMVASQIPSGDSRDYAVGGVLAAQPALMTTVTTVMLNRGKTPKVPCSEMMRWEETGRKDESVVNSAPLDRIDINRRKILHDENDPAALEPRFFAWLISQKF